MSAGRYDRAWVLQRSHLVRRALNSPSGIVALSAPAGFGKSFLAREVQRERKCTGLWWDAATESRERLCRSLWESSPGATLVLENLDERIAEEPFSNLLREMIASRRERVLILCSRHRSALPAARLLAPGDYTNLTAEDLRFTLDEIRAAFPERTAAEIRLIERVTGGWPFAVRLFDEDATPHEFESSAQALRRGAVEHVTEYILREIIAPMPEDVRSMLALVQALGSSGVSALLADDPEEALSRLAEYVPLRREQGTLRLQPLVAGIVETRFSRTIAALRREYAERRAGTDSLESARYYALAGQEREAAALLDTALDGPQVDRTLLALASSFASETLLRHPRLWLATVADRRHRVSSGILLDEARRLRGHLETSEAPMLSAPISASAALIALDLGDAEEAERALASAPAVSFETPLDAGRALVLVARASIASHRYEKEAALRSYERALPHLSDAHVAVEVHINRARLARIAGDRAAEIVALNQALRIARTNGASLGSAWLAAAFGAWFAGDDADYRVKLAAFGRAAETAGPLYRAIRDALADRSLEGIVAVGGPPRFRGYAGLMVAAESVEDPEFATVCLTAVAVEAAEAGLAFLEFLALLSVAALRPERRDVLAERLCRLAAVIAEPALDRSLRSFLVGGDGAPVLAGIVRRFTVGARTMLAPISPPQIVVSALTGHVLCNGEVVAIPTRPLALVLTLAVLGPVPRERLIALLWPDLDWSAAANAFKMCVRRTRQAFAERPVLSTDRGVWSLHRDVSVDLADVERRLREMSFAASLSANDRTYLEALADRISMPVPSDIYAYHPLETIGLRVRDVRHKIVSRLGSDALERREYVKALDYAAVMRNGEPADEASYALAVRTLWASGRQFEAYREFRQYIAECERELGVKPALRFDDLVR